MSSRIRRSRRGRRNGNRRRSSGPARGYTFRRNPVFSMSPSLTDGTYRLRDTLTLSSGGTGNLAILISRSITQFVESKSLFTLYTQVRLLSFEVSITPSPVFSNSDATYTNLQMGWLAIGTNPTTTVTAATTGDEVLAQSDSREFFLRNRITPFHFRSAVPRQGFMSTPFASETSYVFAGCPGSIYVNSLLAASLVPSVDQAYCIITGVYQLTGRTAV